ncbi:hypothetical protein BJ508DRAFT_339010 [Ascobolus immersus RN42]|uniref:Uncharacterized protein n=1 Tax=Ascobolus immersus RN42 TaxID=1160509 RepID=A0A3N4HPV9_ASCIM|nr:hypothetical protein BJ508DRAFT_339010 [Ascobolus immersus RN42]
MAQPKTNLETIPILLSSVPSNLPESDKPADHAPISRLPLPDWAACDPNILRQWSPRLPTINALYNHWKTHRVLHMVSPNSSGKSTLCTLLAAYLRHIYPNDKIIMTSSLAYSSLRGIARLQDVLKREGVEEDPLKAGHVWLVVDDSQETYADKELWSWIKNVLPMAGEEGLRVLMVCEYGALGDGIKGEDIPVLRNEMCRIGMRATETVPIGVALSREEMEDMVVRYGQHPMGPKQQGFRFSEELVQWIWEWSGGHAGVVEALCKGLCEGLPEKDGGMIGKEDIHTAFPGGVGRCIVERKYHCLRGIPRDWHVYDNEEGMAVIEMCESYNLVVRNVSEMDAKEDEGLLKCWRRGCFEATVEGEEVRFRFVTKVHRMCAEYLLRWYAGDFARDGAVMYLTKEECLGLLKKPVGDDGDIELQAGRYVRARRRTSPGKTAESEEVQVAEGES